MILAILKTLGSFAGGLIADALELLVAIWSKAGRAIATVLAIGLGCLVLVQCGEIKTLRTDNLDLQGQRNDLTDRLATCQGSVTGLQSALDDQSARVRAIGEESARRLVQADKAVQRAAQGRQEAERRASAAIAASKGSAPVCDRLLALDALILENAR
jgi:hypothetical protein